MHYQILGTIINNPEFKISIISHLNIRESRDTGFQKG